MRTSNFLCWSADAAVNCSGWTLGIRRCVQSRSMTFKCHWKLTFVRRWELACCLASRWRHMTLATSARGMTVTSSKSTWRHQLRGSCLPHQSAPTSSSAWLTLLTDHRVCNLAVTARHTHASIALQNISKPFSSSTRTCRTDPGFAIGVCSWVRVTNLRPPQMAAPVSRACCPGNFTKLIWSKARDRENVKEKIPLQPLSHKRRAGGIPNPSGSVFV